MNCSQLAITHPGYGVGYLSSALSVPLSVTSVTPSQGSLGGGLLVSLVGTGFATTLTADNAVSFGGVTCAVVSASQTGLTCVTGAHVATSPVALALSASSTPGVAPTAFASVTFTYSPALTDTITAINTTRGSTAGGTPLLITGTFAGRGNALDVCWLGFNISASSRPSSPTATKLLLCLSPIFPVDVILLPARPLTVAVLLPHPLTGPESSYKITLGSSGANCSITLFSTTSITCVTSAPPTANPTSGFQICVLNSANGCASFASASVPSSYRYVNLWSRRSTWGGGSPPGDGDTAFIPVGVTVVMDVSPPRLYLLVVQVRGG